MKASTLTGKPTLVCGHRGAAAYAPENTLGAFHLAADQGAEWVEFDVQLTQDGVPVVMHDDTVVRTTDGVGLVTALSHADIGKLNAAAKFQSPKPPVNFVRERVPDLDNVLSTIAGGRGLGVNIELKGRPGTQEKLGEEAAALVYKYGMREGVLISSFDHARLRALHAWFEADTAARPPISIGMLYSVRLPDPIGLAHEMGANAIHPKASLIDAALVEQAHAHGFAVNTWTVDEQAEMERLMNIGVDMIISNVPDRLRTARDAYWG